MTTFKVVQGAPAGILAQFYTCRESPGVEATLICVP